MFSLDFQSREPIYEQLVTNITKMVAYGGLKPNEQLPSVRALATELGINPNTVLKACQILENRGVIVSVAGKGNFVSSDLDLLSKRMMLSKDALEKAVRTGADNGVTKTQAIELVDKIYAERNDVHD